MQKLKRQESWGDSILDVCISKRNPPDICGFIVLSQVKKCVKPCKDMLFAVPKKKKNGTKTPWG